jgi:hypothetical protein
VHQVGAAGREEVERYGWSAATRKIRELQYARAVRLSHSKRRFGWLALRVGVAQLFRRLIALILGLWAALVSALDYARDYRVKGPIATRR